MKNFLQKILLLCLALVTIQTYARTKLSITTTRPVAMKVIIDGRKYYSQDNNLSIRNLQPGYHNISVYYIKTSRDFNSFFNNGSDSYWKKVVQRQFVIRNNYQYDITINRFGKAFFDQDYYYSNINYYRGNGMEDNDDEDDSISMDYDAENDNSFDENYNDIDFFRKKGPASPIQNITPIHNNFSKNKIISNQMFSQVKRTLEEQQFENSKLEFAKQSLDKYLISTNQAREFTSCLNMQVDKLNFLKFAYDKVIDKENYFTISNQLMMQNDRDELLKYIRSKN
jgi:hypothetical protein